MAKGLGVDEKSMIAILGKWHPEHAKSFRKESEFFGEDDEHLFEICEPQFVEYLDHEFRRLKSAVVLWTTHEWERDARLIRNAVVDGPKSYNVITEIACTRSSKALLGARKAYHCLFDRSIEEDVALNVNGIPRKLLVALVSSYRYEGPRVHEDAPKSEAKILYNAIRKVDGKSLIADEEVVRILSTRSKPHLRVVFKHFKEISSRNIEEAVSDPLLRDTLQCLSTPQTYFVRVLDAAMKPGADENTKEGLTRVVVTRAAVDVKLIGEEYRKQIGVTLTEKIEHVAKGNYKDFLLALLARCY
ncbi:unnamed protein product [Thlaspi arvense]|uniref:Annexin D4 n=1 Tax=Thlaspi arvense TaxID=13288 RepID=A0AAU9RL36_THLAR|nr:unnamed protein product [Thlaspi arvense]